MDVHPPIWFQGDEAEGERSSNRRVLQPPDTVLEAHRHFKAKLRKYLNISGTEIPIASTKEELGIQLEGVQKGIPPASVSLQALENATKSHDLYSQDRRKGMKQAGRRAQEFANGFSQFVSAYSGIVDIVKGAGGPYGEVAYQTLSILLIVVVNKTANDAKIENLLEDIRKSFPKLENWPDIYPTPQMRELVATAYEQVTDFARAATYYFTSFWRRFALAIIAPPSIVVDKVAAEIYKTLAEINSEAMFGLHSRSRNIEIEVGRSGQMIERLEAQVTSSHDKLQRLEKHALRMESNNDLLREALEDQKERFEAYKKDEDQKAKQEDEQRLKRLEDDLGVIFPSEETNVSNTKHYLMQVFPNHSRQSSHLPAAGYTQMSPEMLQSSDPYQKWITSTISSMLFLSGRTAIEGRHYTGWGQSWLSPAAIYIAEDLAWRKAHLAFFSCYPGLESRSICAKQIISSVAVQILKQHPQVLRENAVQLHTLALSDPFRNDSERKAQNQAATKLLRDVLTPVRDLGTTYIILDRLDKCQGKFNILMDELVKLVGDPSCDFKLVIIAETSLGGGEWHPEQLPDDSYSLDRVFTCQDWNQSRLTNLDLNRGEKPLTWVGEAWLGANTD
ncbi:hypothetical protein LSUE1_G003620 [Lachnellula suecica]|uniref:Fungal STAND N-terminal Goodbye domain-containing protein n=1 Tax=Lachnellula suecica TaxID=602035 RepID=A0A8T9CCZ7_9HELO|nr:hypothetical protein LSUE1_G003620 [Lachnellula suecica]